MTRLVLVAPDLDKEFRVETDASNYATRGVLSVKSSDGMQRPVAFISKSLSNIERNYEIHDKEILALVRCLKAQCQHKVVKALGLNQDSYLGKT